MSLVISTATHQGLVLAADSRQSYRNRKEQSRIGSDNVTKLFQLTDRVAVALTGIAFLPEKGVPRNIGYFVDEFRKRHKSQLKTWDVGLVAKKLHKYLGEVYQFKSVQDSSKAKTEKELKQKKLKAISFQPWKAHILEFEFIDKKGRKGQGVAKIDTISFVVAGFDKDLTQKVFIGSVPGNIEKKRDGSIKGKEYGADWIGQIDVISRIVLGVDPRIGRLPVIQNALRQNKEAVTQQLRGLEYAIQWGTMTAQDAVDFCTLAIKTTEAIQRFSDGIAMDPGDMPGVGGEVDIVLITAKDGFKWIKQKELKLQDETVFN